MMGRTHAAAGLGAGAALALTRNLSVPGAFLASAQTVLGALLPDIDSRTSTISQTVKPVGMVVSFVTGHRKILHDPVLYALLFGALWVCRRNLALFWAPLFVGIASHLLLDACNPTSIPIVYPAKLARLRLLRVHTGSRVDKLLGAGLSTLAVAIFIRWAFLHFGASA